MIRLASISRLSQLSLLSASILSLVACTTEGERADSGECPAGEVCSPLTPYGLHFIGTPFIDEYFISGPSPTAIGGTQEIELEYERANGLRYSLDLPWAADDDGALGVRVLEQHGNTVTVGGQRSRKNYLRIVDPNTLELYDRYEVAGAAIGEIRLIGTEAEDVPPGADIVWAPGDQRIGIALFGEVQTGTGPKDERIVDTSMDLSLAGSQRTAWDELRLPNATVGSHVLTIGAGELAARTMNVEIVAGADTITLLRPQTPTLMPNRSQTVCFQAQRAGAYVYGLTWQFDVNGQITTSGKSALRRNCVTVDTVGVGSSVAIVASAGGHSVTLNMQVAQAAARAADSADTNTSAGANERTRVSTEGDRARL